MGSPVVERAFSGDSSLYSKAKGCNHGKAGVLDLCQLKDGFLFRVCGQAQRIKKLSSRVQSLLRVKL